MRSTKLTPIKDTEEGTECDLDEALENMPDDGDNSDDGDSSDELEDSDSDEDESDESNDGLSLDDSSSDGGAGDVTQAKMLSRLNGDSSDEEEDGIEEEAFDVLMSTLAVRELMPDLQAAAIQDDYCRTISDVVR